MKNKLRIACIQRIFPHYRDPIFSRLAANFNFRLYHSFNKSSIKQIKKEYSLCSKKIEFLGFNYLTCLYDLHKYKPNVIIQEFGLSFVNLYLSILYAKFFSARIILWGHGYDRKNGFHPETKPADMFRLFLMRRADAMIVYVDETVNELSPYLNIDKIFIARNSIDTQEKNNIFKELSKIQRPNNDEINLTYVARLTAVKKPMKLVEFAKLAKSKGICCIINIVGDGEMLAELENLVENQNLTSFFIYHGALYKESEISRIIYKSDFMFIPAWLGLSINNSFSYGTPIITLINEQHPPEINFAINGVNAILADDLDSIFNEIIKYKKDFKMYQKMRDNCRSFYVNNLTIDSMYDGFSSAINYCCLHK